MILLVVLRSAHAFGIDASNAEMSQSGFFLSLYCHQDRIILYCYQDRIKSRKGCGSGFRAGENRLEVSSLSCWRVILGGNFSSVSSYAFKTQATVDVRAPILFCSSFVAWRSFYT